MSLKGYRLSRRNHKRNSLIVYIETATAKLVIFISYRLILVYASLR